MSGAYLKNAQLKVTLQQAVLAKVKQQLQQQWPLRPVKQLLQPRRIKRHVFELRGHGRLLRATGQ